MLKWRKRTTFCQKILHTVHTARSVDQSALRIHRLNICVC